MNRIILIGNGFDLAHNLKTGYQDFIDSYWNDVTEIVFGKYKQMIHQQFSVIQEPVPYKDDLVEIKPPSLYLKDVRVIRYFETYKSLGETQTPFLAICKMIDDYNESNKRSTSLEIRMLFRNNFFLQLSKECSLKNWVDVEDYYYKELKKLLSEEDVQVRSEKTQSLNKEFAAVKLLLENYLTRESENGKGERHTSISNALSSTIEFEDIAKCKEKSFSQSIIQQMEILDDNEFDEDNDPVYQKCSDADDKKYYFISKKKEDKHFVNNYCRPNKTLLLNFNYTDTAQQRYSDIVSDYEIVHIHGELNKAENPIIFGYGDELDEDYKKIEKLQDNEFLENIKSIHYHRTSNYRRMLGFLEEGLYQVFIMGHSCGNSDRTLLNTLFEHDNCSSIKVYYQKFENGSDNYSNIIRNISRNFNDKPKMRDIVVNWEQCSPLVTR